MASISKNDICDAIRELIKSDGWNFDTFEKYINQRFGDLSLQLRERYEAQQIGVTAALAAAEKAVNAALIAAEKAVDKAEHAQSLRNEAQNEFRKSLSDLSGLMWTSKEGMTTVESLRRELNAIITSLETKIRTLESNRIDATDVLRRELNTSVTALSERVTTNEKRIGEAAIREATKKEGLGVLSSVIVAAISGVAAAAGVATAFSHWFGH
jgi:chromosome segregation ATPase